MLALPGWELLFSLVSWRRQGRGPGWVLNLSGSRQKGSSQVGTSSEVSSQQGGSKTMTSC